MATTTVASIHARTTGIQHIAPAREARGAVQRRRSFSPESGRALEMLGHAIEYLSDEYIYEGGQFRLSDPRMQATLMLMERSREIYFACPEIPSMGERLRRWLRVGEAA
jgi:hypothetical protein